MAQDTKRMYEGMFLVDSALAASSWDDVESELRRVLERAEAETLSLEKWDDRRLCYDVVGHKRGTYILTYFNADPDRISGIERDVKLNDKLLRILILRADCIPESIRKIPTPYMASIKPAPEPEPVEDKAPSETPEDAAPTEVVETKTDKPVEAEASDEPKPIDTEAIVDTKIVQDENS